MNKTTSLHDLRLYTFIRFSTYGENKKNPPVKNLPPRAFIWLIKLALK